LFTDNMVLQRDMPVPVWGWADPGEEVTVSMAGQTHTTNADDAGSWKVVLKPLTVGKPLEMTVRDAAGRTIIVKDIRVGEVWVCSGQSNMTMGVSLCKDAEKEIAAADYPDIRLFMVPNVKSPQPTRALGGAWKPCSPTTIAEGGWGGFSAAAYYFGRTVHKELGVPIGLISSSWGGSFAEHWTRHETLVNNPALKSLAQGDASTMYNGMIAPLMPFAIRGVIWYQGEANTWHAFQYRTLFPSLIANWRADWGQGDFPFLFVQLPGLDSFHYRDEQANPGNWPELREAQRKTLDVSPNTGMIVTTDLVDDLMDIHPKNKQEVGRRLALWALADVYSRKGIVFSGPFYRQMTVEGDSIRLSFDHVGSGLVSSDGKPLTEFTIAGEDGKFVPATAVIERETILVHSNQVAKPVAVRFAWRDVTQPNLANKEGLPACPFRTDAFKGVTEP
jgi:sialate O-acetylesterase